MEKKLGIFDLDGTLIDAYEAVTAAFNDALETLGFSPVSVEKVKESVGGGDKKLASIFVPEHLIPEMIRLYKDNYARFLNGNIRLLEGCEELLDCLKKEGLLLGIATNRSMYSVMPILDKLNIGRYFDIIFTADDVINPKPDGEMIVNIAEKLGVPRHLVFYAGDMDIDLQAGRDAGVDTYIVSTGSCKKEYLEKIEDIALFEDLVALKKFLIK